MERLQNLGSGADASTSFFVLAPCVPCILSPILDVPPATSNNNDRISKTHQKSPPKKDTNNKPPRPASSSSHAKNESARNSKQEIEVLLSRPTWLGALTALGYELLDEKDKEHTELENDESHMTGKVNIDNNDDDPFEALELLEEERRRWIREHGKTNNESSKPDSDSYWEKRLQEAEEAEEDENDDDDDEQSTNQDDNDDVLTPEEQHDLVVKHYLALSQNNNNKHDQNGTEQEQEQFAAPSIFQKHLDAWKKRHLIRVPDSTVGGTDALQLRGGKSSVISWAQREMEKYRRQGAQVRNRIKEIKKEADKILANTEGKSKNHAEANNSSTIHHDGDDTDAHQEEQEQDAKFQRQLQKSMIGKSQSLRYAKTMTPADQNKTEALNNNNDNDQYNNDSDATSQRLYQQNTRIQMLRRVVASKSLLAMQAQAEVPAAEKEAALWTSDTPPRGTSAILAVIANDDIEEDFEVDKYFDPALAAFLEEQIALEKTNNNNHENSADSYHRQKLQKLLAKAAAQRRARSIGGRSNGNNSMKNNTKSDDDEDPDDENNKKNSLLKKQQQRQKAAAVNKTVNRLTNSKSSSSAKTKTTLPENFKTKAQLEEEALDQIIRDRMQLLLGGCSPGQIVAESEQPNMTATSANEKREERRRYAALRSKRLAEQRLASSTSSISPTRSDLALVEEKDDDDQYESKSGTSSGFRKNTSAINPHEVRTSMVLVQKTPGERKRILEELYRRKQKQKLLKKHGHDVDDSEAEYDDEEIFGETPDVSEIFDHHDGDSNKHMKQQHPKPSSSSASPSSRQQQQRDPNYRNPKRHNPVVMTEEFKLAHNITDTRTVPLVELARERKRIRDEQELKEFQKAQQKIFHQPSLNLGGALMSKINRRKDLHPPKFDEPDFFENEWDVVQNQNQNNNKKTSNNNPSGGAHHVAARNQALIKQQQQNIILNKKHLDENNENNHVDDEHDSKQAQRSGPHPDDLHHWVAMQQLAVLAMQQPPKDETADKKKKQKPLFPAKKKPEPKPVQTSRYE